MGSHCKFDLPVHPTSQGCSKSWKWQLRTVVSAWGSRYSSFQTVWLTSFITCGWYTVAYFELGGVRILWDVCQFLRRRDGNAWPALASQSLKGPTLRMDSWERVECTRHVHQRNPTRIYYTLHVYLSLYIHMYLYIYTHSVFFLIFLVYVHIVLPPRLSWIRGC